jgi:hypothetical protein
MMQLVSCNPTRLNFLFLYIWNNVVFQFSLLPILTFFSEVLYSKWTLKVRYFCTISHVLLTSHGVLERRNVVFLHKMDEIKHPRQALGKICYM